MNSSTRPIELANFGPLAQISAGRLPERLGRLLMGLALYGFSIALLVRAGLGASPWDVFHQGAALHLPLSLGTTIVVTGGLVLLAWIPLRQLPGLGTVANTLLLGPFADLGMWLLPIPAGLPMKFAFLATGVVACAIATALYVGAQLGPGPRDGLMTGLARRTGWSIRSVRTVIEVTVLVLGLVLGGIAGFGTLLFAFAIGPLTQFFLRYLVVTLHAPTSLNRRGDTR
jgi:uncharacterized membrane protein YczE